MQKALENLAKEIRVLEPFQRELDVRCLKDYCDEIIACNDDIISPNKLTALSARRHVHRLKRMVIEEAFCYLNEDILRDGIDTLLSLPKEEREKFYEDVLKKAPHKVGTYHYHLVTDRQMQHLPF